MTQSRQILVTDVTYCVDTVIHCGWLIDVWTSGLLPCVDWICVDGFFLGGFDLTVETDCFEFFLVGSELGLTDRFFSCFGFAMTFFFLLILTLFFGETVFIDDWTYTRGFDAGIGGTGHGGCAGLVGRGGYSHYACDCWTVLLWDHIVDGCFRRDFLESCFGRGFRRRG